MTAKDIRDAIRQQPFKPLRLTLSDGREFTIVHPDFAIVTVTSTVVGFDPVVAEGWNEAVPMRTITIGNEHISTIEPLETPTPATVG